VIVAVFALAVGTAARGDGPTPAGPPPGWADVWPSLTAEEQASVVESIAPNTNLDTAAIEAEMRNVPDVALPADIAAAQADGPDAPPEEGILEVAQTPFPETVVGQNQWVKLIDEGRTRRTVYAGSDRGDPSLGVLIVEDVPWPLPDDTETLIGVAVYNESSGPGGPYRIASVDGTTVSLDTSAAPLVFDFVARSLDHPPDCSQVTAMPSRLWPGDHTFRPISLAGATDADSDPLTYSVRSVTQDEPVLGMGSGDVAPDAALSTTGDLSLRAERQGPGDGRVYRIKLKVSDGKGGSCEATVTVGVPHQTADAPIVDSGLIIDSFSTG
jgi:hypothetical protein